MRIYINNHLLLSLLFISIGIFLYKLQPSSGKTIPVKPNNATTKFETGIYTDTTIILFDDSSYKLRLHIFDTANKYEAERNNAVLTFTKQDRNQIKVFFRDSMFCMYPDIDFQDLNNDKIKDILVFYYTGARANPTYHLYLTDIKNHKLIRVRNFEELPNPYLDPTNNIITSIALSGTNYYSFYRINTRNNLINLGHSFEENPEDSTQYERAIRQILRKKE